MEMSQRVSTKKRQIFVTQLLVGRFSNFKGLNALKFNSKHFCIVYLVVGPNLLSKKDQKLQNLPDFDSFLKKLHWVAPMGDLTDGFP